MPDLKPALTRLLDQWPTELRLRALDYVLDGRISERTQLDGTLTATVRGYTGTYRTAVATDTGATHCDCGRRQPCQHAVAVAEAGDREPASFVDIGRLLAALSGSEADVALAHVVRRTLASQPIDGATALLELAQTALADSDAVSLDSCLSAARRFAIGLPSDAGQSDPQVLLERARALAQRQGRTAGVLALTALLCACLKRASSDGAVLAAARTVAGELQGLLAGGGLNSEALIPALLQAGEAIASAPVDTVPLLLTTLGPLHPAAADYLNQCLLGVIAEARARALLDGPGSPAARRVAELVPLAIEDLLHRAHDGDALALARFESSGPAGSGPLLAALTATGRYDEAITIAAAALAAARGEDVPRWRRQLADLQLLAGRPRDAVPYLAANFERQPTVEGYRELRDTARSGGVWSSVGSAALACLRATCPEIDPNRDTDGEPEA